MNQTSMQPNDDGRRLLGRVRKARIADLIRARGFMSSSALAEEFGVSEMTVRRDLAELDTQGELIRTHGGAVAPDGSAPDIVEPPFDDRSRANRTAKLRIAATAEGFIQSGHAVALDVGTTTYELARCLASRHDAKVFTNNLRIAALLGSHAVELYLLGGRVRLNEMSLCGPVAVQQARKLWFDIAFIGVSGIAPAGLFDYSIEEVEVKQMFLERASQRIVLCDSSKFDRISLVQVGSLDEIHTLVTDAPPPKQLASALEAAGVSVVIAGD